jgi:cell division protein FtsL
MELKLLVCLFFYLYIAAIIINTALQQSAKTLAVSLKTTVIKKNERNRKFRNGKNDNA